MKRWWRATEGIRFVLVLFGAVLIWVAIVAAVRS